MTGRRIVRWVSISIAAASVIAGIDGCFTETGHENQHAEHSGETIQGQSPAKQAKPKQTSAPSKLAVSKSAKPANATMRTGTRSPRAAKNVRLNGTLVSLGDSITYGFNLPGANPNGHHPSPDAYPALLGKKLKMHVINLGIPRWTTEKLIAALKTPHYESSLQKASLVTVDIGSNNLLHAFSGVLADYLQGMEPASFAPTMKLLQSHLNLLPSELSTVIKLVRRNTDAPIILTTIYDPAPDQTPMHTFTEPYIIQANDIILHMAATKHTLLYDAYHTINHQQWTMVRIMHFDIHPTIAGQHALAGGFVSVWKNPVFNQPTRYAITTGTSGPIIIHKSPSTDSKGIGEIKGVSGYPVVSQTHDWAHITWQGESGYVLRKQIQEIVRFQSDVQFGHKTLVCQPMTWHLPNGDPVDGFATKQHFFVPVSALARIVNGHATWNNAKRSVRVSGSPAPALANKRLHLTATPDEPVSAISVTYTGIGVRINGALVRLVSQPFSYRGNIYVPVDPIWTQLGGQINPLNGRFSKNP